jgi:integrase
MIDKDEISKGLKKYVRSIGLDKRLHFHSLRHTFSSWLVQSRAMPVNCNYFSATIQQGCHRNMPIWQRVSYIQL